MKNIQQKRSKKLLKSRGRPSKENKEEQSRGECALKTVKFEFLGKNRDRILYRLNYFHSMPESKSE